MITLKAPFNFVPLRDKVFLPEWADQISQDIPFLDEVSGEIELTITAESPVFVRNGHTKEQAKSNASEYLSFSKVGNQYFLPGSSVKGVIRSVLEIMSYGKMNRVENDSFGLRDLSPGKDGQTYKALMKNVHCGWLYLEGDNAFLDDCGEPERISVKDIDNVLGTQFYRFITDPRNFRQGSGRDARIKYERLYIRLTGKRKEDRDFKKSFLESREYLVQDRFDIKGVLVLTGQPGIRNPEERKGKQKEFIFKTPVRQHIEIDPSIFKAFKSIHKNSTDYDEFWKIKMEKGEKIPVFFQYTDGASQRIHSIGLSYMYRFPNKSSVYDGIYPQLRDPEDRKSAYSVDLPEAIFGYTKGEQSLRGRVQIGHAFAEGDPRVCTQVTNTLSSPHSSYYPLYLGDGKTWNDQNPVIAGRKRYPVRNYTYGNTGTANTDSSMIPLDKGTVFKGKIRFHNLKEVELGALLSVLTFHGQKDCCHNIGAAKPLGYGKIKMKVHLKHLPQPEDYYMTLYENLMNDFIKENWLSSVPLRELFAMARGIPQGKDELFTYMRMDNNPQQNEFNKGRKEYNNGERLGLFSEIITGNVQRGRPVQRNSSGNADRGTPGQRPYSGNRYAPKTISVQEKEYGWELEIEERLHAYINENQIISICNPDRSVKTKNIICKYKIDDYSKIKKVKPNDVVKIYILEKEEDTVWINIDWCDLKNNRYQK